MEENCAESVPSDAICHESEFISTHDYVGNVNNTQKAYCEKVRDAFKLVEAVLLEHPCTKEFNFSSRCFATARTHLEIACMYAIKGTVFEGKNVKGYCCK